jgi:predicted NUDIX family NTP pyrophosphohydrolase
MMNHRTSAGLAIVYQGMVLLAHTAGRKWQGSYGIPKGGVEEGESLIEAAMRETLEEVGINVPKRLIDTTHRTYVLTSKKYKQVKTVHWFIVKIDDLSSIGLSGLVVPKRQLQLDEVDWAGFITLDEAKKRVMQSQATVIDNLTGLGLLESRVMSFDIYINKLNS